MRHDPFGFVACAFERLRCVSCCGVEIVARGDIRREPRRQIVFVRRVIADRLTHFECEQRPQIRPLRALLVVCSRALGECGAHLVVTRIDVEQIGAEDGRVESARCEAIEPRQSRSVVAGAAFDSREQQLPCIAGHDLRGVARVAIAACVDECGGQNFRELRRQCVARHRSQNRQRVVRRRAFDIDAAARASPASIDSDADAAKSPVSASTSAATRPSVACEDGGISRAAARRTASEAKTR